MADVSEPILEVSSVLRSRDDPLGEGREQVGPLKAPQNTVYSAGWVSEGACVARPTDEDAPISGRGMLWL